MVFRLFREKGDHYYTETRHKDLFPHYNLILRKVFKKCPEKRLKIQAKCSHTPWASYNTPQIELIQYGRRIGKKCYSHYKTIHPTEKLLS